MGVDLTRDQSAYGVGQPLIGVPNKPIVSDRNPTANDKATLGQIWVNPTVNTAFILVSINNNAAIWAIQATPIAGNIIVPGFVQAGNGLIALAGGVTATGNSSITGDLTVSGNITSAAGDIAASATHNIYGGNIETNSDPTQTVLLYENALWGGGTNADVDVEIIPKGDGAFILDGLWGGVLLSQWRFRQASVQTVDAVPTVLFSVPLADSEMVLMKAYINGFKDDYLHALSGEVFISAYRPNLGNVTQIGAKVANGLKDNGASATVTINAAADIPSQSLNILVTGAAAETWNWVVTANFMYTTHP